MPGLGASFGRGAATDFQQDMANADCILIMGSNMAEAHPVGFRFPMRARERGAHLIHVDPHFSRTSAMCNTYVATRTGTDIAFLGAIINHILTNDKWFKEYVLAYTNASTIIEEGFEDTEDLSGIFSGYDSEKRAYDADKGRWSYEGSMAEGHDSKTAKASPGQHGYGLMGLASGTVGNRGANMAAAPDGQIKTDPTLQHPRCVFQLLKRHYARYTPQVAADICGCKPEEILKVAELLCSNSGRERTGMIVYALGWTQHTTGVQMIRAAGIIQLLLGNMGRPGGGIMAMRGHCTIQGSTDIPTLYDLLPGYLPQPAAGPNHESLDAYLRYETLPTGYWYNTPRFMISLLKAYYGQAANKENDYGYNWLPRIDDDYSMLPFFKSMAEGNVEGYFLFGQNPAAGAPNAGLHRAGLRKLKWLVVLDWFEHETAMFWKDDPKGPPPGEIGTEVFFFPVPSIAAKEGSFTNTQRLVQWHDRAVDPERDCRSDLWFVWNLGRRLKELYAGSTRPRDQAIQAITWDYHFDEEPKLADGSISKVKHEPDANKILQEINGYFVNETDEKTGKPKLLKGFSECKDDGTTACGGWIYSGVYPSYDRNRARERIITSNPVQPLWGFAWPHNRRMMYNRASADPQGRPWSDRKAYVWWDPQQRRWVGYDEPDFEPDKSPDYRPPPGARGMAAIAGDKPFIMHTDGLGWLFAPGTTKDGPFPAHYEPEESPFRNTLYKQQDNPTARYFEGPMNVIAHTPESEYPIVATTYRLTEHYLSGPMSRFNSWLNELQPAMFVEMSPELAKEKGMGNGDWCTIHSARGTINARAMVTPRIKPLVVQGRTLHQIGLPFHWSFSGEVVGGQANDLIPIVADPNVSMHEAKSFACQLTAGIVQNIEPRPTKPFAPWPFRKDVPDTPRGGQPEGHLK
ncbi:MAG TPA: molybdopterin-dependent oxidoreductase [Tepidisphaeraceae bacterium]|nr:molybdopterin-dependent oxidoreductase [Tepidisphaeraceae bacterium]